MNISAPTSGRGGGGSRTSSLTGGKPLMEFSRPPKLSNNSSGSLLRFSSNDSNGSKTPKGLSMDGARKLDEFMSNVRQYKSPPISKARKSDTPQSSDKKRLVKQFYEDTQVKPVVRSYKVKNNDLQFLDVFDETLIEIEDDEIDREFTDLKNQIIKTLRLKITSMENGKSKITNLVNTKTNELYELLNQLTIKYKDSSNMMQQFPYKELDKYKDNDNIELDLNLQKLNNYLNNYKHIISRQRELLNDIEGDLESLEKLTRDNYEKLIHNRNQLALFVVLVAVCYMIYIAR